MKYRVMASMVALAAVIAVLSLAPAPLAGQAPRAGATKTGTLPRTAWGHPDLQGVWTTDELVHVPLERPREFGDRALLTEKEFAARVALEDKRARDEKSERTPRPDDPGAGPEHWYERGKTPSLRTSLIVDPPDGRIPAVTPEAQKRAAARAEARRGRGPSDSWEDRSLQDRCITRGLPATWMPSEYNNGFQIAQAPDSVTIFYERNHEFRVIPLDGRPHVASSIRQYLGDSRGRWEGDTLVVDVTNFTGKSPYRGSGETLHLIERFSRVDAETIKNEFTVDDPTTWTKPWTVAITAKHDPNYRIFEFACHEGNYAIPHILSGARAEEKAAEEAARKGSKK